MPLHSSLRHPWKGKLCPRLPYFRFFNYYFLRNISVPRQETKSDLAECCFIVWGSRYSHIGWKKKCRWMSMPIQFIIHHRTWKFNIRARLVEMKETFVLAADRTIQTKIWSAIMAYDEWKVCCEGLSDGVWKARHRRWVWTGKKCMGKPEEKWTLRVERDTFLDKLTYAYNRSREHHKYQFSQHIRKGGTRLSAMHTISYAPFFPLPKRQTHPPILWFTVATPLCTRAGEKGTIARLVRASLLGSFEFISAITSSI